MKADDAKKILVDLAKGEVGYHEGANNWNKYAEDPRISELYGWNVQNQPWCCTFVNWCFLQAFGDIGAQMTYGGSAACANQAALYRKGNAFYTSKPEAGDQIFFYSGGGINHTGIVVEVNGSAIRTVEGNYSDKVSLCSYQTGNSVIAGYGRPNWNLLVEDWEKPWVVVQNGQIVNSSEWKQEEEEPKPVVLEKKENHSWRPGTLKPNDRYDVNTVILQGLLTARGFPCGEIDGYFGPLTEVAVNHAKRYYSFERNGEVDYAFWIKLLMIQR